MKEEKVILVDAFDNEVGTMEKLEAHEKGQLHRAFSVFLYNSNGEMLLQQRALHKYHSPGLWTNTCCSHPRPGESNHEAAQRRLMEEMGIQCKIEPAFSFMYEQKLGDLIEHELDHVFIGTFDGVPEINPEEVAAWKTISEYDLLNDVAKNPENYTVWFRLCLERVQLFRAGKLEKRPLIPYLS
jgi:isopentenyl-diphosphate delta-isomerase